MKDRLSDLQAATAEWLDGEMRGHAAARGEVFDGLARMVSMDPEEALVLLKRWRRESRYRLDSENNARETEDREPLCYLAPETLVSADAGDVVKVKEVMGWSAGDEAEPAAEAEGEEMAMPKALAAAAGLLLNYFSRKLVGAECCWSYFKARALSEGESVETFEGSGEMETAEGPVEWLVSAVVVRDGEGRVVVVFPDCRIRRRLKRKGGVAIQLERVAMKEQMDYREAVRRMAAALKLYRGEASGLGCQKRIAELAGVKKQSVNEMLMRMAGHYHQRTGGRAGFEGIKTTTTNKKTA